MTRAVHRRDHLPTTRLLLAPLALLLLLLAFAGRAEAGAWGPSVPISTAGQYSSHVRLGSDAAGDQVAVWERNAGTNEFVVEAAVRPAQGSWSTPVEVSTVAPGPRNPDVAVNSTGEAIVVWQQGTISGAGIKAALGDTSGNWDAPETVSVGFDLSHPTVGIDDNGNAVAAWREELPNTEYGTGVRVLEGGAWGSLQTYGPNSASYESQLLAVDPAGDAVLVMYYEGAIEAVNRSAGGSWGAVETLKSGIAARVQAPQLAISANGEATAIWANGTSGNASIEAARMDAAGIWGNTEVLPAFGTDLHQPSIAIDDTGKATAIWANYSYIGGWAFESATQEAGEAWTAAPAFTVPVESYEPQIKLMPSGAATVIWWPWRGSAHHYAVTAAERAADGSWGPELELGDEGEEIYYPVFTTDAAGGVTVAWVSEGSSDEVIRSVALTPPSPPEPPEPPSPPAGGGGDGTTTTPPTQADTGKSDGAKSDTNAPLVCTATPDAVAAAGYVPLVTRPGKTVPGVRARISVPAPSTVSIAATFEYKDHGKARSIAGGTYSLTVGTKRNLRVPLPSALRAVAPLGSTVGVSLRIAATPTGSSPCAAPTTTTSKLKLKVVQVLAP
ncbi:MAG: hypothetical protein JST59_04690 [Actinobacteria bacterium]|nr:hypothetical protein [Actinomycetota bacterium]